MTPFNLDDLINYLEATPESSWLEGKCRSKDQSQHCLVSHIYNFGGGDELLEPKYTKGSSAIDFFEERWATTFMFYKINDGEDPLYPQATAKARCIAYLKDLRDGKAMSTLDCWKELN